MNNYVYIIASLPVIQPGAKVSEGFDADRIIEDIKSQCTPKDCKKIDFLLKGFDGENLNMDFYREALGKGSDKFLREYFATDLMMRNEKVRFINRALERPMDMDIIDIDPEVEEETVKLFRKILQKEDLLERERGIDDFLWDRICGMTLFNYFDLNVILSFIAKLHIIDRWLKLDENIGRERFRQLVDEVRGTFKGVEFDEK